MNRNLIMILVGGVALAACAALQTEVGPRAAKAINRYCLEPQSERLVLRQQVNSLVAPNSVQINCEGDPP